MATTDAILHFAHVTKEYRSLLRSSSVIALDNFSLTMQAGEIFGFLGPNGAGKTTAIHLAMGFMRPTRGTGTMLGHPFGHAPTRRRVGFLSENVALYHLPASRLVRFYGALNGMGDPLLARHTREVLESLDIQPESRRSVGKYSRGMLQRVGLAQALVNDPDLLVLDEPTSALDPLGRVAVRELLVAARNSGKTIFLSSHLLSEIELICDRVAILNLGRLVRLGKTGEMLESHRQSEIVARGIDGSSIQGAAAEDGFHATVPTQQLRYWIERIWASGVEVVRVNPVRRSLEDVFLELTSSAEVQSSGEVQAAAVRTDGNR
jgi:ABC-2 type transport system ATP-binding protein